MHIPRLALASLLITSLLVGCGGADKEEIYRAKEFMMQVCQHEAGDQGAFSGMILVKTSKPYKPVPDALAVAVSADGVTVDGVKVITKERLANNTVFSLPLMDTLAEQRQHDLMLVARAPGRQVRKIVLGIDASIPARSVHVVLNSILQAGYQRVLLATEPTIPPQMPTPPDRLLDDELRRVPDDQLPLFGANKMAELAGDCPPLAELFSVMSFVPPQDRCQMFADALGEVFGSTACKADINKVLTLMHAMTVPRRPTTIHQVALTPRGPEIATKPADTWAQVAHTLLKRGNDQLWIELPDAPTPPEPPPQ